MKFTILLTHKATGAQEVCEGTIADVDRELFALFHTYASELREAVWVRDGLDAEYSLDARADGVPVVTVPNRPTDTAVRELLMLLRPFLLNDEATYFPKVTARLREYLTHPYLRAHLDRHRKGFADGYGRAFFTLSVNDVAINDQRTFDWWLNAFHYHRDPQKRAKLLAVVRDDVDELTLAVFRSMIADKALAILTIDDFWVEMASSRTALANQLPT